MEQPLEFYAVYKPAGGPSDDEIRALIKLLQEGEISFKAVRTAILGKRLVESNEWIA